MKNILCEGFFNPQLSPDVQLKRVQRIILEELTDLQRDAIVGVYFQGKTLAQIAGERCVCKSTVYRTLKRGEAKLKKFLKYG